VWAAIPPGGVQDPEPVEAEPFLTALMTPGVVLPSAESLLGRPKWMDRGACRGADQDRFYPERGHSVREAKALCRECEVCAECLDYAMVNVERYGIWGGLSEKQRRKLRRDANRTKSQVSGPLRRSLR
jgi:WhiB family redox-sensing transcriptional regulator